MSKSRTSPLVKVDLHPEVAEQVTRDAVREMLYQAADMLSRWGDQKPTSEVLAHVKQATEILDTAMSAEPSGAAEETTMSEEATKKIEVTMDPGQLASWASDQVDAISKCENVEEAAERLATFKSVMAIAKAHWETKGDGKAPIKVTVTVLAKYAPEPSAAAPEPAKKDAPPEEPVEKKAPFTWPQDLAKSDDEQGWK
jgi:hypothetical protein